MANAFPVSVRAIRPTDAATWKTLRNALWSDEEARHDEDVAAFFAGTLQEPAAVLLAETTDGQVVGLVELSLRTDIPELHHQLAGYVEGLYIAPSARFQQVARHLLAASRSWAHDQNCSAFASDREDRVIIDRSFSKSAARKLS